MPPDGEATGEESWTWLARIRRTQGRKGEVFAEILTDFPERFAERRALWLLPQPASDHPPHRPPNPLRAQPGDPRPVELRAHWLHKGGIVLHLAGVDSISAAEALTGMIVAIPRAERAPLGEGEVYIGDLIGCTLVDVAPPHPAAVGEIEDVDTTAGPTPLLVIRGRSGEVLVPFARSYLRRIDLEGRSIEMALPEGLVDLNRR